MDIIVQITSKFKQFFKRQHDKYYKLYELDTYHSLEIDTSVLDSPDISSHGDKTI